MSSRSKHKASSSSKASSSRAPTASPFTNGSQGVNGSGSGTAKKLSTLSSLQSTLKFSLAPSPSALPKSTSSQNGTVNKRPKSASPDKDDRELMPPPPIGLVTKTKANGNDHGTSIIDKKKSLSLGKTPSPDRKGKGKEIVIEVDDDDDDIAFTGSAKPKPVAPRGRGSQDMWTDSFGPNTEAELAPSKTRVSKVKAWLHEALYGYPPDVSPPPRLNADSLARIRKYKRILLLSGPAGGGKTTTVRTLAKEMGIELLEWGEGADESVVGSGLDRESSSAKLLSFLSRHSYTPLSMHGSGSLTATTRPRLILLTGLPNLTHLPTKEAFHSALLSFCQSFSAASCPLVIVHSDAGSGGRAEESWLDRDRGGREGSLELLGKAVKEGPWCQEIDFLPVAPTFMTKALERILSLAMPQTALRPPKSALQLIAMTSNGDLRSAVNSLQMLCNRALLVQGKKRKGEDLDDDRARRGSGSARSGGRGSRGGKGAKLEVSESLRAVLDAVTRKEQNLSLFHALGKVLYNKRLGDPGEDKEDQEHLAFIRALETEDALPTHLQSHERRKSLIHMETFLPTVPIDTSSFALWLHENSPKFVNTVEESSSIIENLCRADIMKSDDDIWQASPQAIAYALNLSIRGTLMGLPSPVPRAHQKITKPHFFDSYRSERDNVSKLDIASGYIVKKAVTASNILAERDNNLSADQAAWGGLDTRRTLATELIPMMIKIQAASRRPLLPSSVQSLALPAYHAVSALGMTEELDDKTAMEDQDDFDESAAGEDGLGTLPTQSQSDVWDDTVDTAAAEEEEEDGIREDEIEDWD